MNKELYKKALIELGKRVDLVENPNYIIKLALEKAIDNETIDNNYIKHLGNLWGQTQMVDVGSYTILKQALTELEELKKEVIARQETENSLTQWVADLTNELEALKKSPTELEVIKALSECFTDDGDFIYDDKYKWFTTNNRVVIWKTPNNELHLYLSPPPHLITLIGKFYESLEGEKWTNQKWLTLL